MVQEKRSPLLNQLAKDCIETNAMRHQCKQNLFRSDLKGSVNACRMQTECISLPHVQIAAPRWMRQLRRRWSPSVPGRSEVGNQNSQETKTLKSVKLFSSKCVYTVAPCFSTGNSVSRPMLIRTRDTSLEAFWVSNACDHETQLNSQKDTRGCRQDRKPVDLWVRNREARSDRVETATVAWLALVGVYLP